MDGLYAQERPHHRTDKSMKKAFTLIELLVVIAIIAILAAILFPVFAQAKTAAKKAAAISNGKQTNLGIQMYMIDSDDVFPRNDDCQPGSSLNPALKGLAFNPTGVGCTAAPFYNRMNHYSWHKWIYPYVKNVEMFFHPAIGKYDSGTPRQWSENGQVMGSFALNLALTGALNTYNRADTSAGYRRNSWKGGSVGSIGDPAQAMLLVELVDPTVNFSPVFTDSSTSTVNPTAYPMAVREAWEVKFYKITGTCTPTRELNSAAVPFAGSINLGYVDGHMKTVNAAKFLADTPTAAEYQVTSRPACGLGTGSWTITAAPVWNKPWPMWALD